MKPFNHMTAYEFAEWKMTPMSRSDKEKLASAVNAVITAMMILETIDDENDCLLYTSDAADE